MHEPEFGSSAFEPDRAFLTYQSEQRSEPELRKRDADALHCGLEVSYHELRVQPQHAKRLSDDCKRAIGFVLREQESLLRAPVSRLTAAS